LCRCSIAKEVTGMKLTRRSFLSSSLATGVAAAAQASHAQWLLSSANPVRLGLLDTGAGHLHALSVFSAIPGAQIAGIVTAGDARRIRQLRDHLKECGQIEPAVYRTSEHLLSETKLQAFVLSGDSGAGRASLGQAALAAGRAVLLGEVFTHARSPELASEILSSHQIIRFSADDFLYPASRADVKQWLIRHRADRVAAKLTLRPFSDAPNSFNLAAIAFSSLLSLTSLQPDALLAWSKKISQVCPLGLGIGQIPVPQNEYGVEAITVNPFGVQPGIATLSLAHRESELTLQIGSDFSQDGALKTAVGFLRDVKATGPVDNLDAFHTLLAASTVENAIGGSSRC
jgi:hypothetical protein